MLGDYAEFALFNYQHRLRAKLQHVAMVADPHHNQAVANALQRKPGEYRTMKCDCVKDFPAVSRLFVYQPGDATQRIPLNGTDAAHVADMLNTSTSTRGGVLLQLPSGPFVAVAALSLQQGRYSVAVIEPQALATILAKPDLYRDLLPATLARGLPTDSLAEIAVYASAGERQLYGSHPDPQWLVPRTATLPEDFGGLRLRVAMREAAAPRLIIGGMPESRLPLLVILLALAAGLSVIAAAQLRRERALVQMRERFVTSVSHELRTPLAQIRLFLETLRLGRATTAGEREWAISNIEREATRLTHLVENVLHVAKSPSAQPASAPIIDTQAELRDIIDSFRPLAKSRRVTFDVRLHAGLYTRIRREHLRQLMLNLLDNAVKYGPPGQIVTIELSGTEEDVLISVTDEGPGVRPDDRNRIWEAYYRGSTPEVEATGGAGVGLSIVKGIVAQYGGSVSLDPSDKGACFTLRLPRIISYTPSAEYLARQN